MFYKKQLKWLSISFVSLVILCITIYYASITRAENLEEGTSSNLGVLFNFVKEILPFFEREEINNASLIKVKSKNNKSSSVVVSDSPLNEKSDDVITLRNNSLNRDLLNICLAKAEDEWVQLQAHYTNVLTDCLEINLGLNGEKLFSNEECEKQIAPYREKDKQRIQADKLDCFKQYSERE